MSSNLYIVDGNCFTLSQWAHAPDSKRQKSKDALDSQISAWVDKSFFEPLSEKSRCALTEIERGFFLGRLHVKHSARNVEIPQDVAKTNELFSTTFFSFPQIGSLPDSQRKIEMSPIPKMTKESAFRRD